MNSLSGALIYGVVKLVAYTLWCWIGLKWSTGSIDGVPGRVSIGQAIAAGSMRWVLGLMFGVVIFFMFSTTSDRVWQMYLAVYTPVRVIEWGIIGLAFSPDDSKLSPLQKLAWVAGGILVSFASDMVSPEMIESGRFCVGRCLC